MGIEQPASYYDELFSSSEVYKDGEPWRHLWTWIADQIAPWNDVLDLGCGPGHLAALLTCSSYLGIDFSPIACAQASKRHGKAVLCGRLPDVLVSIKKTRWSTVIACEFLEHIEADLACLSWIAPRTRVIATVPKFDDAGHVRYFTTEAEVVNRYDLMLGNLVVQEFPMHWGFSGERR